MPRHIKLELFMLVFPKTCHVDKFFSCIQSVPLEILSFKLSTSSKSMAYPSTRLFSRICFVHLSRLIWLFVIFLICNFSPVSCILRHLIISVKSTLEQIKMCGSFCIFFYNLLTLQWNRSRKCDKNKIFKHKKNLLVCYFYFNLFNTLIWWTSWVVSRVLMILSE